MITSVRRLATRVLCLSVSFSISLTAFANQEWLNSYEDALEIAKREGKPIFADFSTTWCHNCKQLDRETLSDPAIAMRLDEFVKVRIDGDQRPDIVQLYQVQAYPTLLTLDPAGRMVDKTVGFVRPPQLAGSLDQQKQMMAPALAQMKAAAATPANGKKTASAEPSQYIRHESQGTGKDAQFAMTQQPASAPQMKSSLQPIEESLPRNTGKSKPVVSSNPEINSELKVPQPTRNSTYAEGNQPAAKVEKTPTIKLAAAATPAREIMPLLSRTRTSGSPGGGDTRHNDETPLVVSQAEPRKTPASAVAETASTEEELPRPLLKTGSRATATPTVESKTETAPKPQATENTVAATKEGTSSEKADAASDGKSAPATTSAGEEDEMATIRKLQKSSKSSSVTTKATPATKPSDSVKSADSSKSSDTSTKKPDEDETKPAVTETASVAKQTASPENNARTAAASDTASQDDKTSTIAADSTGDGKKPEGVSGDDIERWIKDADSKLIAGHKREARAMYAKVYEKDPKSDFGRSDMAFIKMVSLMVDEDDDALRRKALNKIKEFEALFPESEHKDYYTLIRATLAADLGDTNAAHRLLETFADRFPNSKYQKLAYDTWKSLPPVKKETSSKQVAKETGSKKTTSTEKKKSSE